MAACCNCNLSLSAWLQLLAWTWLLPPIPPPLPLPAVRKSLVMRTSTGPPMPSLPSLGAWPPPSSPIKLAQPRALAYLCAALLCSRCGAAGPLLVQGAEGVGRLPGAAGHRLLRRVLRSVHPQRHQHPLRRRAHPGRHALRRGEVAGVGWFKGMEQGANKWGGGGPAGRKPGVVLISARTLLGRDHAVPLRPAHAPAAVPGNHCGRPSLDPAQCKNADCGRRQVHLAIRAAGRLLPRLLRRVPAGGWCCRADGGLLRCAHARRCDMQGGHARLPCSLSCLCFQGFSLACREVKRFSEQVLSLVRFSACEWAG